MTAFSDVVVVRDAMQHGADRKSGTDGEVKAVAAPTKTVRINTFMTSFAVRTIIVKQTNKVVGTVVLLAIRKKVPKRASGGCPRKPANRGKRHVNSVFCIDRRLRENDVHSRLCVRGSC